MGKFRNNVEKGEWVLFTNTSFTHKLRILLQKPHYPILPYTQILTNKMILKQRDLSWSEFTELFVCKKWKMRVELSLQHLRQVKVVQIQHWRLIHMIVMGKFLTEYEKTEKDKKKCSKWFPGRSTYYGVNMKINYECSLVHPCFWIHKLSIQSYFDMTCKWSRPRQCICKLSIKGIFDMSC